MIMSSPSSLHAVDVVIVGGSYAGLSAAMPLVRGRRNVVIIDDGQRRNASAHESHGFLTRDGCDPAEVARLAREDVSKYPTASFVSDRVTSVIGELGAFLVGTAKGAQFHARVIVLAMGVTDVLPDIPGLRERWGGTVFTCPYCHGYELNLGRVGIIGTGPGSYHQAWMFPEWGETTLFLNDALDLDSEQSATLEGRSVTMVPGKVKSILGNADVELENGDVISFDGLAIAMPWHLNRELIDPLGCEITESPMGDSIKTQAMGETSVPGVLACGDCTHGQFAALAVAVGEGYATGAAAHRQLLMLGDR